MRRLPKVMPLIAGVLLVLIAPLACIRFEQWEFRNAAGVMLMSTGGFRLIGMGPPAHDDMPVARITGHGSGWFGLFSFAVDETYEAE